MPDVGALKKDAGGVFFVSDRSGYAARGNLVGCIAVRGGTLRGFLTDCKAHPAVPPGGLFSISEVRSFSVYLRSALGLTPYRRLNIREKLKISA